MKRKELFKKMLEDAKKEDFGYIGTGNLDSKILIIGKEVAIAEKDELLIKQYQNNQSLWNDDLNKTIWDIPLRNLENHSPICPYKGQYLKINKNENWGTSRTWYNYQKLHNYIFGDSYNRINFHKNFFLTEINSKPSPKTIDADTRTIKSRKDFIKTSEYFQSFPIVILAGLGYFEISENYNEIEEMFKVKFEQKDLANGKVSNPYWIHWNENKTKLVINTQQLSMGVSDSLLMDIAMLIKESNIDFSIDFDILENAKVRWEKEGESIFKEIQKDEKFIEKDEYKDFMTWV
ncbi:MAG: hypothetical protein V4546_08870 [Bacteroidota bacterium]